MLCSDKSKMTELSLAGSSLHVQRWTDEEREHREKDEKNGMSTTLRTGRMSKGIWLFIHKD